MQTFSALLAICAGNSPVPVNSPHKGQWGGDMIFSLICVWINGWVNNCEAGDLRRHRAHYDVTLMTYRAVWWSIEYCWMSATFDFNIYVHNDVMTWKRLQHCQPFQWGIFWSGHSLHKEPVIFEGPLLLAWKRLLNKQSSCFQARWRSYDHSVNQNIYTASASQPQAMHG